MEASRLGEGDNSGKLLFGIHQVSSAGADIICMIERPQREAVYT